MTLKEKRHAEISHTLDKAIAQRDLMLRKLIRNEGRIEELRRKLRRLDKAMLKSTAARPDETTSGELAGTTVSVPRADDTLAIPTFLQRSKDADERDRVAREAVAAEVAERKRNKTRVRIDTMKAKQRGDHKRMPLTGKAAAQFIRETETPADNR